MKSFTDCLNFIDNMTQKNIRIIKNEIYSKPPKRTMLQTKQMFIIVMIFGV